MSVALCSEFHDDNLHVYLGSSLIIYHLQRDGKLDVVPLQKHEKKQSTLLLDAYDAHL